MVTVFGPIESLEKYVQFAVDDFRKDDRIGKKYDITVAVNEKCSIENYIKNNLELPREVREHAIGEKEVAVQVPYSRFLGLVKGRRTVVSLTYPFRYYCVVVTDSNYDPLGRRISEIIKEEERKTPELWFM